MKDFFEIMEKDIRKESFSKMEIIVYGILVPLVLIAIMGIAGWLETAW